MVSRCASLLYFISSLVLFVSLSHADDFTTVEQRLVATLIPTSASSLQSLYNTAKGYSESLQPGGFWKDIDYTNDNRAVWPAAEHINPRLLDMATAYVSPGQPFYKSAALYTNITAALNFWLAKDFQNPNWWWNEIGIPTPVGQIAVLLKSSLTQAQVAGCVKIMNRADWDGWTGANLVWMANIHIYRGFTTNNQSDVSDAFTHIYDTIAVTTGINDGIKTDGSFYQHGQQLYSGGYGADFTSLILPYLNITTGTQFYIGADQLQTFGLLVLDGQQWMTYYGYWDDMVIGRQLSRPSSYHNGFEPSLLVAINGPRHAEYVEFAQRLQNKAKLIGNKHFWKSDYMSHHQQTFSASIRMYSTRTFNSECVNEEGLQSLHLADGVFNIYQTGQEYVGIFPVWDWERIPGTTCALGEVPISCATLKVLGKTNFVGGVTDGNHGVAAHDFRAALNGKLAAKKSWFLFENEVVALGANISCGGCKHPIVTTIDQHLLSGDVYASGAPSTPISSGNRTLAEGSWWVFHDEVGYVFPQPQSLGLANGIQEGTWQSINQAYSGTVQKEVFNFWINQKDGGDTYEYLVLPNISLSTMQTTANKSLEAIQVLHNTPSIQAVYHSELQILSAVFWEAGNVSVKANINSVAADYPSIVLVSVTKSSVSVYVSEPTQQTSKSIQITLGVKLSGEGCLVDGNETVMKFQTSSDPELAGQTMMIECNLA